MAVVAFLLLLALLLGGVGFFVESLHWLILIAFVLVIAGALHGGRYRNGPR